MKKNKLVTSIFRPFSPKLLKTRSAFTLLEIMAVVMIIGLLMAFAITQVGGNIEKARKESVKGMIHGILKGALATYEMENGTFPTTEQGLKALIEKPAADLPNWRPYLDKKNVPQDPWQQDYIYVCPGVHNTDSYDLSTKSKKDSVEITNWE